MTTNDTVDAEASPSPSVTEYGEIRRTAGLIDVVGLSNELVGTVSGDLEILPWAIEMAWEHPSSPNDRFTPLICVTVAPSAPDRNRAVP